jgi:hypothetical protein
MDEIMSIVLDSTVKKLELVLGGAVTTNEIHWMTNYADKSSTTFTPGVSDGVSNGTTDVIIVSAPSASVQRLVNNINIYNADTVDVETVVKLDNDGTERVLVNFTMPSGYTLQFANDLWRVLDNNGLVQKSINTNAANINVVDTDGNYDNDNVETVLEEIKESLVKSLEVMEWMQI